MSSVSTWVLPPEPDIPAVHDVTGKVWTRERCIVNGRRTVRWNHTIYSLSWPVLLSNYGPLTTMPDAEGDWTLEQCDRVGACERPGCGREAPLRETAESRTFECRSCWDLDTFGSEVRL